jgi:hypothetical protein
MTSDDQKIAVGGRILFEAMRHTIEATAKAQTPGLAEADMKTTMDLMIASAFGRWVRTLTLGELETLVGSIQTIQLARRSR